MIIDSLFIALVGTAALMTTLLGAAATIRRRPEHPHLLMTAGLLGSVFFAAIPASNPVYGHRRLHAHS